MDEGNFAVNVSAIKINQGDDDTRFLQIVRASLQSGGNRLKKHADLDSGSTVSFVDQRVREKLRDQATNVTLNIAGKHGMNEQKRFL